MKFSFLLIIFLAIISVAGFAQVNEAEFQNLPNVNFINYSGPYSRLNTREEIRQLGVVIGRQVASGAGNARASMEEMSFEQRRTHSYSFQAGASNRYFIIHCVSGPVEGKIDADIMGLGVDTALDHIRNLRVVIQGYLQEAYGYDARDAGLLAEYITIYNAVYRGDWDYFTNRFKPLVIENLVRERAGLSIRYDEWPGRTMMLIPLGYGGLSSIDTSVLSDDRVIEELRREDDMGVTQRQGMVDLMEREADQAQQRAQAEREAIRQDERQLQQERQDIDRERQRLEDERQRAQDDQDAGRISEEEARRREEEARRREEELAAREREAQERERELEQRRDDAQRLEELAEQRSQDAQQARQEIAVDQQTLIRNEETGGGDSIFGIMIERVEPTAMGRIIRMGTDGRVVRRSPVDTVHTRTVTFAGGKILTIAGENRGNGAVRIVEINQNNLEIESQGNDDIMTGSLLWVNGNDLYAITVDLNNNICYLGRFNTNMALQARSAVRVHPSASVVVQQGTLITQREDGSVLLLNPASLAEIR